MSPKMCDKIMSNFISTPEIAKYEDLFAKDVTKQITIAGILEEKYKKLNICLFIADKFLWSNTKQNINFHNYKMVFNNCNL